MWVPYLGCEDPLEEATATHSSTFAWRIPWTEQPGGLQSMASQRVRHNWSDLACMHARTYWIAQGTLLNALWWPREGNPKKRDCIGSDGKESACNAGDLGLIPGSGRSPGEGNGYPLQYSCLENSMDRWAWWNTVYGVTKSQAELKD